MTIYAIFIIIVYFLPAIVAACRGYHQQNPVFILNPFFGWTLIGWVVCLAWKHSSWLSFFVSTQGGLNGTKIHGPGPGWFAIA
jgi:hypothetical protein